jgi:hypothetical protein
MKSTGYVFAPYEVTRSINLFFNVYNLMTGGTLLNAAKKHVQFFLCIPVKRYLCKLPAERAREESTPS